MFCAKALDTASIVDVFNQLFLETQDTRLCGGANEPLYTPSNGLEPACINFRADYCSSALHEAAHWCIAGAARRRLVDYGYWYNPDGRSDAAQQAFADAEARPQAMEWCFAQVSGIPFRLSLDNLDSPPNPDATRAFATAVITQARALLSVGLPPRGRLFFTALAQCRDALQTPSRRSSATTATLLGALQFSLEDLL